MKKAIALLLALTLLLSACGGKESAYEAEPEQITEPPATTEPAVAVPPTCGEPAPWKNEQVTDFAIRLLQKSMEEEKNTLISPLSVLAALSMTANGAEGETLTQMETVLGQSKDALNNWYKEDMGKGSDYLHLSNALFIKDDPELTVSESFIRTIERYYMGEDYASDVVRTLFNEYTVDGINQYVEDCTNGMI